MLNAIIRYILFKVVQSDSEKRLERQLFNSEKLCENVTFQLRYERQEGVAEIDVLFCGTH